MNQQQPKPQSVPVTPSPKREEAPAERRSLKVQLLEPRVAPNAIWGE
jgi:hypothetical protein